MPVARVLESLTPAEYMSWRRHLARYPPLGNLVALLWFTVARALGGKPDPKWAGEWLVAADEETPADDEAVRVAQARMTTQAYARKKERAANA